MEQVRALNRDGFSDIKFKGQYPICYVNYKDPESPVIIELEAFSPFVPLNLDDSSFPATVMHYTVKNTCDKTVTVDVVGWLENAICSSDIRTVPAERYNEIEVRPEATYLKSSVRPLAAASKERIDEDNNPAPLESRPDYGTMALSLIGSSDPALTNTEVSVLDSVFCSDSSSCNPAAKPLSEQLLGSLGRRLTLEPGQSDEVTFIISWFFPKSRVRDLKTDTTRWYASRFKSASDVAESIISNFDSLATQTRLWKQTWYDSTLPYWFLDRTFLNTSILATETCFRFKDGRFYGEEGVYCCPGTCTHVWGYVQATGRLFPTLEKSLREMVDLKEGIGFFPQSGEISMRGEFDKWFPIPKTAVDGQSGIILRTYREHQMSVDDSFLRRNYDNIKKAMNFLIDKHDDNHDGIMEGAQHNTLDAEWYGKITWLSLYYCAALRATERMALEMGDVGYAKYVGEIADKGGRNIASELFNGEYFIQKPDPEHPDSPGSFDGCEYSQLLGQNWAYQVGLGRIIDNAKVKKALHSLWRYNFSTDVGPFREQNPNGRWYTMPGEGGLIACTFPRGGSEVLRHGERFFAGYLNECQNGYEYGATSLMMWEGMVDYAFAHTRTLHERYHASRRNPWNEIECGEHYSRSMASYGLFTAVCGFEYHGPKGYIAFSPRLTPEDFRAAFTSAQGWGTFSQKRNKTEQIEKLELAWGKLRLKKMVFDIPTGQNLTSVQINVSNKRIQATYEMIDNRVVIKLTEPVVINAGQEITVTIHW
jgi:non-lysosomal glucosylceramidase